MGDAKRRAIKAQQFLLEHPLCIHCGKAAETVDHCPPRSFFKDRGWPETYEFPACSYCNSSSRLDEQALAVLVRARLNSTRDNSIHDEFASLVAGVKNNQPALFAEWTSETRNGAKRQLREIFGRDQGDAMRLSGWGVLRIGPMTTEIVSRFMIKMAKALYYRHNHHVFRGAIYTRHVSMIGQDATSDAMMNMLQLAPDAPVVVRSKQSLTDQFDYRFNHSPEHRAMYAVVQFSEQFVMQLFALSQEMDNQIRSENLPGFKTLSRHEFF